MIKFISKFLVVLSIITAGVANAGIITTDLTEDTYITSNDIDWTWASPINVTTRGNNTLYGPDFHMGWRYATDIELQYLKDTLTLSDFAKKDALGNVVKDSLGNVVYINSIEYWNTDLTTLIAGDIDNFNNDAIKSQLSITMPELFTQWYFETFYVRNTVTGNTQVPEPSTFMIFAIALIALSIKKRMVK
jgi:hypothetical protein